MLAKAIRAFTNALCLMKLFVFNLQKKNSQPKFEYIDISKKTLIHPKLDIECKRHKLTKLF